MKTNEIDMMYLHESGAMIGIVIDKSICKQQLRKWSTSSGWF